MKASKLVPVDGFEKLEKALISKDLEGVGVVCLKKKLKTNKQVLGP